jgi:Holliday junction resolvasome RuvABC ATP-dependent DNA helicase subunit
VNLVPYTDSQLSELVIKSCYRQHQLELPVQIANTIAKLSHKTPRLANMILSNLIEVGHGTYSEKLRSSHLDKTLLEETLKMMGVDPLIGLNRAQRLYLKNLLKECTPHSYDGETMPPNCKCLGIKPLANMCKEQQNTIENFIEPPLLQEIEYVVPFKNTVQKGALVKITKFGRTPLQSAWMYMKTMENFQKKLNWFETEDFTI